MSKQRKSHLLQSYKHQRTLICGACLVYKGVYVDELTGAFCFCKLPNCQKGSEDVVLGAEHLRFSTCPKRGESFSPSCFKSQRLDKFCAPVSRFNSQLRDLKKKTKKNFTCWKGKFPTLEAMLTDWACSNISVIFSLM